jgi:hypothetical protein
MPTPKAPKAAKGETPPPPGEEIPSAEELPAV